MTSQNTNGSLETSVEIKVDDQNIKRTSKIMAGITMTPQVISRLMTEIKDLIINPPEDIIYIEQDDDTVTEIHAQISGPGNVNIIIYYHLYNLYYEFFKYLFVIILLFVLYLS